MSVIELLSKMPTGEVLAIAMTVSALLQCWKRRGTLRTPRVVINS